MKRKYLATLSILLCLLATVTGCASGPRQEVGIQKEAFDRGENATIKKIAVVQVTEPAQYIVLNVSGVAPALLGNLGTLIEDASIQSKSAEFTQEMIELQLALGDRLTHAIETELKKRGFEVTFLQPSASDADGDGPRYSVINDADALLDVRILYAGYISPYNSYNYFPWIRADARLLRAMSGAQLYFQAFSYGGELQVEKVEHLPSLPNYTYGDFGALMANTQDARDGIQWGVEPIAARIAQQLSGTPAPSASGPTACDQAQDYARRAEAASGEARAMLKRMSERKAEQCKAERSAGRGP